MGLDEGAERGQSLVAVKKETEGLEMSCDLERFINTGHGGGGCKGEFKKGCEIVDESAAVVAEEETIESRLEIMEGEEDSPPQAKVHGHVGKIVDRGERSEGGW